MKLKDKLEYLCIKLYLFYSAILTKLIKKVRITTCSFYLDPDLSMPLWSYADLVDYIDENSFVLDVGTGIGVIPIIISQKTKFIEGVDIDKKAIQLSNLNAKINEINNVKFYVSDIFSNVTKRYDIIISNPPFLAKPQYNSYFFRCCQGDFYKNLFKGLGDHLNKKGRLVVMTLDKSEKELNKFAIKYHLKMKKVVPSKINFKTRLLRILYLQFKKVSIFIFEPEL